MSEVWRPWPKQEIALKTVAFELLFGGSRGPGKTDTLIVWMVKPVKHRKYRGLVIRKNADDLRDFIDRARWMWQSLGVEVVGMPVEFRFPSGAKIRTGHLKDDNAYEKYQGHEYQRIGIEELTQIPDEERYLKLIASCRSTVQEIDPRVFCTTNPLGPGHSFVKKRFVDPAPPMTKFKDPVSGRTRIFIPGTVEDNPTLMEKDPEYIRFLDTLPDNLCKAWRHGSWDVLAGAFFDNFDRAATIYNPADVKIGKDWPKFRSIDWGYSAPMACYWHAVAGERLYTYREWYKPGYLDRKAAREIHGISHNFYGEGQHEDFEYTVGDPQSFPTKVEVYNHGKLMNVPRYDVWAEEGIPMIMGDSSRVLGWSRMRQYLEPFDYMGKKVSHWQISSQCVNLIEELTSALRDDRNPEDISGDCQDHGIESCRLGMMSRLPVFEKKKTYRTHLEAAEAQIEREEAEREEEWD